MWWGIGAYFVFGAGAIFTYYYSVIKPAEEAAFTKESNTREAPINQRPRLGVIAVDLIKLKAGELAAVQVTFKNTGNVTARRSQVFIKLLTRPASSVSSEECPEPKITREVGLPSVDSIPVNTIRFAVAYTNDFRLTAQDVAAVKEGKAWIFVWGKAVYEGDLADTEYFTEYYGRYNPTLNGFEACPTHNDSN